MFDLGSFFKGLPNILTGAGQEKPDTTQANRVRDQLLQNVFTSSGWTPQQALDTVAKLNAQQQRAGQEGARFSAGLTLDTAGKAADIFGKVQGTRTENINNQALGAAKAEVAKYEGLAGAKMPFLDKAVDSEQWQALNQSGDYRYGVDAFYNNQQANRDYNMALINQGKTGRLLDRIIGGGLALASFFG